MGKEDAKDWGDYSSRVSQYILDLEWILDRIENASNHYQVLNISRTADIEQIKVAYQNVVSMLKPSPPIYGLPDGLCERVGLTFEKAREAFSVLSNAGKRAEHDHAVFRRQAVPLNFQIIEGWKTSQDNTEKPEKCKDDVSSAGTSYGHKALAKERSSKSNIRRCARFNLSVPVRVTGYDKHKGKWLEIAKTVNASRIGTSITLSRRVPHGSVLHLQLPYPQKIRAYAFGEQTYSVYGIVRNVDTKKDGTRIVGVEFLGPQPPIGFNETPWAIFKTPQWVGPDRRKFPRRKTVTVLRVQYLDEQKNEITSTSARTEDISRIGVRICTKDPPSDFEYVRLSTLDGHFKCLASLRNRFLLRDGFERLCLMFEDNEWPD